MMLRAAMALETQVSWHSRAVGLQLFDHARSHNMKVAAQILVFEA
jgi:hypothetical protein